LKLWIDDVRKPPESFVPEYIWVKTVHMAKEIIQVREEDGFPFELIDIDHDAGDFGPPDYIAILDWLEETGRSYPIRIHSMNPVGVENMRRIIQRNGWKEVR
jgi:hypothetical protein